MNRMLSGKQYRFNEKVLYHIKSNPIYYTNTYKNSKDVKLITHCSASRTQLVPRHIYKNNIVQVVIPKIFLLDYKRVLVS